MFGCASSVGDGGIEPLRVQVVEQQAHAHPPLGRLPERLEQQVADVVAIPDEVLHVERLLCGACEQDARGERIAGVGQPVDARLAGIRSDAGRNRAAEPRPRRVGEGGGLDDDPLEGAAWRSRSRAPRTRPERQTECASSRTGVATAGEPDILERITDCNVRPRSFKASERTGRSRQFRARSERRHLRAVA